MQGLPKEDHQMKIPCFVIYYNRPSFLRKCVDALLQEERIEVIVIDNNSTEPHGLQGVKVIRLTENLGHTVIWNKEVNTQLQGIGFDFSKPYLVADCDIVVPSKIPWLDVLLQGMERLPSYNKFGLGLNTSQIPSHYPKRDEVIRHETRTLYKQSIMDARFFEAPVDTTLALYRGGYNQYSIWGNDSPIQFNGECKSLRTFEPYECTHLTWHMTKEELAGEEQSKYRKTIKPKSTHWS